MDHIREFCAENMTLVPAAVEAGARRIELCDNLAVGGTTPSHGVIRAAVAFAHENNVQVMAMMRPRGGDFVYSKAEAGIMLDDIRHARDLQVSGVVLGCLRVNADGRLLLDAELTKRLVDAAKGPGSGAPLLVTFHMAFDELDAKSQLEAIDLLASLGVERILTHGGPLGAPILDHVPHLRELVHYAGGRITILPGGGITWRNAEQVASLLWVHEVHGTKVVRLAP